MIAKIRKNIKAVLIILGSIAIWILFALFLPGYRSSSSVNVNAFVEGFFIVMTVAPFIGIGFGIYSCLKSSYEE